MKIKKSTIESSLWIGFFGVIFCAALALRLWEARLTSFWCDEIAWIRDSYSSSQFFHHVRSTGPLGPFDPFGIVYLGHFLEALGVHPHVAYRGFTVLLSFATAVVGLALAGRRSTLAWLWFLWCLTHTTIHAMAVNARPYMSPVFFGALGLWIALTLEKASPRRLWAAILLLCVLGSLSQPYVDFTHIALMASLLVGLGKSARRPFKVRALFALGAGLLLTVLWLAVIRQNLTITEGRTWGFLWNALKQEPWRKWLVDNLHAFAGVGPSLWFFVPLWALGCVRVLREKNHGIWAYGVIMLALALLVPPLLALKHGYFYVPRQALAALPLFGFLAVQGALFTWEGRRAWALLPAAALLLGTVLSNGHWLKNVPPFVDMPRYRLETTLPQLAGPEGRPVVVLSQCHWGVATLYSSPENFRRFFQELRAGRPYAFEEHGSGVHLWTSDVQSCFGVLKERADDSALDGDLRRSPENYAVLAFQGLRAPRWLPSRCRYEYGAPCLREE